jgi:hypothetical protein
MLRLLCESLHGWLASIESPSEFLFFGQRDSKPPPKGNRKARVPALDKKFHSSCAKGALLATQHLSSLPNLPLKLSVTPFCKGLHRSINAAAMPCVTIQDNNALDTNSGL